MNRKALVFLMQKFASSFCYVRCLFVFQSVECSQRCKDNVPSDDEIDEEERSSDRFFIDDSVIDDRYDGSSDLNDHHLQRGARTTIYSSPSPSPSPLPPNPYLDNSEFFGLNKEKKKKKNYGDAVDDVLSPEVPDTQRLPIWDDVEEEEDEEEEEEEEEEEVVEDQDNDIEAKVEKVDLPRYTLEQVQDLLNRQCQHFQKQTPTRWKGKGKGKGRGKNSIAPSSKKRASSHQDEGVTLQPTPPIPRTHLQPPPSMPLGPQQLVLPPPPSGSKVSSDELKATEVAEALERLTKNRIYLTDAGDISVSAKADSMSNVERLLLRRNSTWKDVCKAIASPIEFFKLKGLSDQVRHFKKISCCLGPVGRGKEFHLSYTIGE